MMPKRKVTAEDLFRIRLAGDLAFHPDKPQIAVVVTGVRQEDNRYQSQIWLVPAAGGEPKQFTNSLGSESFPVWSPDGKWLAFLSDRNNSTKQLFIMPEDGGEATQITSLAGGVKYLAWSPDGTTIAFLGALPQKQEEGADGSFTCKGGSKAREKYTSDVKIIDDMFYRLDGSGYLNEQTHLHVVDVRPLVNRRFMGAWPSNNQIYGTAFPITRITGEPMDVSSFDWSPDGTALVFSASERQEGCNALAKRLYLLPFKDGESNTCIRSLTSEMFTAEQPRFSPDGNKIAFRGHNNEFGSATNYHMYVFDLLTNETVCVTKNVQAYCMDGSITDTRVNTRDELVWSPKGDCVYSLVTSRGSVHLAGIEVKTGDIRFVTQGAFCVRAYSFNRSADQIGFTISTPTNPSDVYVASPAFPVKEDWLLQVTDLNKDWLSDVHIYEPKPYVFQNDVWSFDGWALLPSDFPPQGGFPTVLQVHGGPAKMYSNSFMFEFQLLAASGMAVIYTNPRGSVGYGQSFCNSIWGGWGTVDFQDIEAGMEAAVQQFPLNPTNIAIAGGSYGGFMAAWAISHTKRYRAAVIMRAVTNWYSMIGTSDIGFASPRNDLNENRLPWQAPDRYLEMSPISYVDLVRANVLLMHSEEDYRCPIEQAEQYFVALRLRNVAVEFVRFPSESHGLSRNGKPWHRVFRLEKIQTFLRNELLVSQQSEGERIDE